MASALGRPQFFTGKGEWSHWLASFMPWLALQTVNTDAECIGMALSFIKGEALTHFKNSGAGNSYYGALKHGDDVLLTWEEFSECLASCPTDWYYTPQSIRSELDKLKAGPNFRVYQAKMDQLLARAGDMDQSTRIYFYLKSLPDKYQQLFKVDSVLNKDWQSYADLKAAVCKRVQMEGWNVGPKPASGSYQNVPRAQGYAGPPGFQKHGNSTATGTNTYRPQPYQQAGRGPVAGAPSRGGYGGGLRAGNVGQPAKAAVHAARGGPVRGRGGSRGGGRFTPYRQSTLPASYMVDKSVPTRYRQPAIINAVASGLLTSNNLPPGINVDPDLSGKLRAPLPVVDFIGQPITPETRGHDFEQGACFYCHHVGHIHNECPDWAEAMTKEGYLPCE